MEKLLELQAVTYYYEGEIAALRDFSLQLWRGECVFVAGPNGCGKSTLFRLLNGLAFATQGNYYFEGARIDRQALQDVRFAKSFHQKIGYVFQNSDTQLFNPTVYDEIAFAPRQMALSEDAVAVRVQDLLQYLELQPLAKRAPYHLSGGEKKKVAIAAVLAQNPELLILDEPFNGLDETAAAWLRDFIKSFKASGKTLLLATHDKEIFPLADRLLQMQKQLPD